MNQIQNKQNWFARGLRDGIPIGLGYLAVSFALGITARKAGLTAFQATLASLLNNASAGEYAGFTVIASQAPYLEMAVITLVVNARYLLMSAALSQRFSPDTPFYHRLFVAHFITDEIFGASIMQEGALEPFYNYGLAASSLSMWALGTCLGVLVGNVLPARLVMALGVLLYGMFIAIIIPPARKSKIVLGLVIASFACSYASSVLPVISSLSEGNRIIVLTVILSLAAAVFFPIQDESESSLDKKD